MTLHYFTDQSKDFINDKVSKSQYFYSHLKNVNVSTL